MNKPNNWPPVTAPGSLTPEQARALNDGVPSSSKLSRIIGRRVSSFKIAVPRYLKPLWYPLQVISMVAGRGGSGKSTIVLSDIAAATRGTFMGEVREPVNVALIAPEDDEGLQKARLKAAGADLDRIFFIKSDMHEAGYDNAQTVNILRDKDDLTQFCREESIRMLVIDPINVTMQGSDSNKRDDVRRVLDTLTNLANVLDMSVICIAHVSKGGGNRSDMMAGSAAFRDVPRSALVVAIDDEGRGVVEIDKNSYGEGAGKAWDYVLESQPVIGDDGQPMLNYDGEAYTVPVARVLGETNRRVEHIANRTPETEEKAEERATASNAIIAYLEAEGGSAPCADVLKALERQGYSKGALKTAQSRSKHKITSQIIESAAWWVLEGTEVTCNPTVTRENVAISTKLQVTAPEDTGETSSVTPNRLQPPISPGVTCNPSDFSAEYQQKTEVTGRLHAGYTPETVTPQGTRRYTSDGIEIEFNERQNCWQPTDPTQRRKWQTTYPHPELTPADNSPTQDALDLTD